MKKYYYLLAAIFAFVALPLSLSAQSSVPSESEYQNRYNLLVKNLGPSGVGIETLLDRWNADYPEDVNMMVGRFSYYYFKAQTVKVVPKGSEAKYLGNAPLMSLKDSLGNNVNYFEETFFDDSLFGIAASQIDRAVKADPLRLDFRFLKVSAYISYEKNSPDMAMSELKSLIDYNYINKPVWNYPEFKVDNDFFKASIQDYCFSFFKMGVPVGYEAFKLLSQKMLDYNPDEPLFLDNMGSYYLVAAKDNKKALKYYNSVLKKHPDDMTAIRNCVLLARNDKNVKLEKKYLPMVVKYSQEETERTSASIRLKSLK